MGTTRQTSRMSPGTEMGSLRSGVCRGLCCGAQGGPGSGWGWPGASAATAKAQEGLWEPGTACSLPCTPPPRPPIPQVPCCMASYPSLEIWAVLK